MAVLNEDVAWNITNFLDFDDSVALLSTNSTLHSSIMLWYHVLNQRKAVGPLAAPVAVDIRTMPLSSLRVLALQTASLLRNWKQQNPSMRSLTGHKFGYSHHKIRSIIPGTGLVLLEVNRSRTSALSCCDLQELVAPISDPSIGLGGRIVGTLEWEGLSHFPGGQTAHCEKPGRAYYPFLIDNHRQISLIVVRIDFTNRQRLFFFEQVSVKLNLPRNVLNPRLKEAEILISEARNCVVLLMQLSDNKVLSCYAELDPEVEEAPFSLIQVLSLRDPISCITKLFINDGMLNFICCTKQEDDPRWISHQIPLRKTIPARTALVPTILSSSTTGVFHDIIHSGSVPVTSDLRFFVWRDGNLTKTNPVCISLSQAVPTTTMTYTTLEGPTPLLAPAAFPKAEDASFYVAGYTGRNILFVQCSKVRTEPIRSVMMPHRRMQMPRPDSYVLHGWCLYTVPYLNNGAWSMRQLSCPEATRFCDIALDDHLGLVVMLHNTSGDGSDAKSKSMTVVGY